jgi:vancomycin permeability regulator SanA
LKKTRISFYGTPHNFISSPSFATAKSALKKHTYSHLSFIFLPIRQILVGSFKSLYGMLQKIKRFFKNKWVKRITGFLLAWLIIHIIYICVDGCTDYQGNADVAIILGNTVFSNGKLSYWLQGRVDKAFALYKAGKVKKIFASGGISKHAEGDYPEGDAMKNYLLQHGVPETDIIADNGGQNTYLTAKDFIAWNTGRHYTSAIVVSQFYHITRCKYIFRKLGFTNVYNASSEKHTLMDVEGTLREVPAFYKYLLYY